MLCARPVVTCFFVFSTDGSIPLYVLVVVDCNWWAMSPGADPSVDAVTDMETITGFEVSVEGLDGAVEGCAIWSGPGGWS